MEQVQSASGSGIAVRAELHRVPPRRLTARVVWSLLGETFFEWYEDRAPRLGAALAFYTVFALAPGLVVIIAVAALLLGEEAAQGQIIDEVRDLVGFAGADALQAAIESTRGARSSLIATSVAGSLPSRSCSGSGASSGSCRTH
jgi:uncharacterized BrkB/YihY/UPF0761 family membrane protein